MKLGETYKMNCSICRKYKVKRKDYRFIDSCGLQGSVLSCEWCFDLNDVAVAEIIRNGLDPKKEFYNKHEEEK